jgi:hypothetical protein
MKHNTKIIILITTALVLTSTLIGLVSTWKTHRTGGETVAQIERLGRDSPSGSRRTATGKRCLSERSSWRLKRNTSSPRYKPP